MMTLTVWYAAARLMGSGVRMPLRVCILVCCSARSKNCEKRLLLDHVRVSVLMERLDSHWTGFNETCYLSVFRISVEKI
jgi:hypothetical protein